MDLKLGELLLVPEPLLHSRSTLEVLMRAKGYKIRVATEIAKAAI